MINGNLSIPSALKTGELTVRIREVLSKCQSQLESSYQVLHDAGKEVETLIFSSPDPCIPSTWKMARTGLAVLASQGRCLAIAHGDSDDLPAEQARLKVLFGEFQAQLRSAANSFPVAISARTRDLVEASECDCTLVAQTLLALPLPMIYWEKKADRDWGMQQDHSPKKALPPIVRIIAQLDGVPIATPQLINPDRLYSVRFQVRGIGWPENAESLNLSLLSTCPFEEYSISPFELPSPRLDVNREYTGQLAGHIKFNSAQSTLFDDIVFRLRGAFKLRDGEFEDVPIIGYHELRLRVVKQDRHPLMGASHRLDRHIEELLVKLTHDCPRAADEIAELQLLLQALNHLITTYAQEAIFKGVSTIPESEFHKTILRDLGLILGSDVQNHPHQAGGIGDIRYRGVITELKVEKDIHDRHRIAQTYAAQGTQYQGAEARQVSVLLVLDLTPKDSPPGDLRNDILLVDVPTHGGSDDTKKYPSKAFVVVINGNVKSPSDYSK
jgi:hypothetical protein